MEPIRLPTNVKPRRYIYYYFTNRYNIVYTKVDLNNFTFAGVEKVDLYIIENVKTIRFHSVNLSITVIKAILFRM